MTLINLKDINTAAKVEIVNLITGIAKDVVEHIQIPVCTLNSTRFQRDFTKVLSEVIKDVVKSTTIAIYDNTPLDEGPVLFKLQIKEILQMKDEDGEKYHSDDMLCKLKLSKDLKVVYTD